MKVIIKFEYSETVIPPRCQKPRLQQYNDGRIALTIAEVSELAAPVAVRKTTYDGVKIDYRVYQDAFWVPYARRSDAPVDREYFSERAQIVIGSGHYMNGATKNENIATLEDIAQKFLVVGDTVFEKTCEPIYRTRTFGLGNNHGGTSLTDDLFSSYSPEDKFYFNLIQKEEAIAYATRTAVRCGDTKSLPIKPHSTYEIILPETLKFPMR